MRRIGVREGEVEKKLGEGKEKAERLRLGSVRGEGE